MISLLHQSRFTRYKRLRSNTRNDLKGNSVGWRLSRTRCVRRITVKVPPKHISTSAFTNLGPVCTPDHEWPVVCITQYHFVTPIRSAWRQETQCCQSHGYHLRRTRHTSYALSGITDFIHNTDMKQTQQFKHLQFMPKNAYTLFQKISNKQGTLSPIYNKVYQGDSCPSNSEC